MARNPDNSLSNNHLFIQGGSGSGKTRWLSTCPEVRDCARVLLWDPEEDHRAVHCRSLREYQRALIACLKAGRPFRLALTVDCTAENFQAWCALVWAALDGRHETVVIVEEIADVTGSGKAIGKWGEILRKARKYNARLCVISQRPQEVDKTTVSMCPYKWAGVLENDADRRAVAKNFSIAPEDFFKIQNEPGKRLMYFFKTPGPERAALYAFDPRQNTAKPQRVTTEAA